MAPGARKTYLSRMKTMAAGWVLALVACAHGPAVPPQQAFADWHGKYPLASQELCMLERANPPASRRLLQWEADNPVVATDLLQWIAQHPSEPLPGFLRDHPSVTMDEWFWGDSAVHTLVQWARRHPDAAQALADDPEALQWSAQNQAC